MEAELGRPHEQFEQRCADMQKALREQGLDAVVLKLPENILAMTGHWVRMGGLCFLFIPAEGRSTLTLCDFEIDDARETWSGPVRQLELGYDKPPVPVRSSAILSDLAEEAGCRGGRIGYEGGFEYLSHAVFGEATAIAAPTTRFLREALQTDDLVDVTSLLTAARSLKNSWEIARLRRVNEIADVGLELFKAVAQRGVTEVDVAAHVEQAIRSGGVGHLGTRDVRAYAMVCSGAATSDGWQPFRTRRQQIEADDLVMIEMGVVADGYWCDRTRTVSAGRATPRQRAAYRAVRAAQRAAIGAAEPDALASEVDAVSRRTCLAHGFVQYPHHTGHGVGFGYHELTPTLSPDGRSVLGQDMTLAIEPGVYGQQLGGGIRWEDTVLVTKGGGEVLGGADFDLE